MVRSCLSYQVFLAGVLACISASGERLRSPWDAAKITPTDAPYVCPAPPAFDTMLHVEGYYTDKKYSVIDPKRLAAFNEAAARPTLLGQYATTAADAWLSKGSRAAATCVYTLLGAAANADAWDGKMPDNNGVYLQNWMLSGTAMAYLKVRDSHMGTVAQDAAIQRWFRLDAGRVREYFDVGLGKPGSDAWNNHMDWAGLGVAAEGVAHNDEDVFTWGLAAYRMGVDAIQPDGSLDAEMNRGRMALHYQLYALGPLVMLAELGETNGIKMYAMNNGAIHRLVQFDVAAMKDPAVFAQRAGVAQEISKTYSGLEIGWAVPYVRRFPDAQLSAWIAQAPWLRFWQWGGAPPEARPVAASEPSATASFQTHLRRKIEQTLAAKFPATSESSAFFGLWCVEADTTSHESITDKGNFILLTNQISGDSVGLGEGAARILALAWGSVAGNLTPDRSQIDWSNGSYWARCPSLPMPSPINLTGKWYTTGRNSPCSIQQHGDQLTISDGRGYKATGKLDASAHLSTEWNGSQIGGVVTADCNHINWDNHTYWTRAGIYDSRPN